MNTGFVGLGAMGAHMARNLHRAGLLRGVWNRSAEKAAALAAELPTRAYTTLATLAADCNIIIICVAADADVRSVVAGLESGLESAAIVIDCSTVSAATAREMHALLAKQGVGFLDCPVSGGVEGARLGTLAMMAGGGREGF